MWKKLRKYFFNPAHLRFKGRWEWLNSYIFHPELWKVNKQTIPKAIFLGLFLACMPIPGQALLAGIIAYFLRVNLPVAVAITWITNPFTFVPINYGMYKVGQWVTGEATSSFPVNFLQEHMRIKEILFHFGDWFSVLGKTFLTGVFSVASVLGVTGYSIAVLFFHFRRNKDIQ